MAASQAMLRAFHAVVPPLLRGFRPQILVSQHGCDTHWLDPLAGLRLSIDAQRAAGAAIHELAHQVAGGRWLLTGGGGYELLQVVPRPGHHGHQGGRLPRARNDAAALATPGQAATPHLPGRVQLPGQGDPIAKPAGASRRPGCRAARRNL